MQHLMVRTSVSKGMAEALAYRVQRQLQLADEEVRHAVAT